MVSSYGFLCRSGVHRGVYAVDGVALKVRRQVRIAQGHGQRLVSHQLFDAGDIGPSHD
jgi:hypothetical protein